MRELNLATIEKRGLAFFLDEILLSIVLIAVVYDKIINVSSLEDTQNIIYSFSIHFLVLRIVYHTLFIYLYGATIGKMICKIKCVDFDGEKPNFKVSLFRAIVRILARVCYILALFGHIFLL